MNDPRLDQMIERMRKKVDRMMAGGMRTQKIANKIRAWADGCWRGLGRPEWLIPDVISGDAIEYANARRKQSLRPTVVLRKSGETEIRHPAERPAEVLPPPAHARWVCGACLREYKKSREGQISRGRFLGGDLSSPWRHGRWPSWVYHDNGRGLCSRHRGMMKARMISRYRSRNEIVIALGFAGYHEYLDSDLWRSIRRRCFDVFGSSCHFCGRDATQVHHARYDERVMAGEDMSALYPVCGQCHHVGEFAINGDKLPPESATGKMRGLGFAAGHHRHIHEMDRRRACALRDLTRCNGSL